jgi:ABC-type dipeptide/oligopeptide/nickel transport system ATPase component
VALLRAKNLTVSFGAFKAVDDVSFRVKHGETTCLVGESGSGKSMVARSLMGLLPSGAKLRGTVSFEEENLFHNRAFHTGHPECGRSMAMIFQEPMASLNPSMRVETLVGEAYRLRTGLSKHASRERICEVLHQTGIQSPEELLRIYPWQLSGGLAQRVMIASCLILKPRLLIADEPTTALDVTTQAQILSVLLRLRDEASLALLFITHDLSIAALMGGETMVMKEGQVVESGRTIRVLEDPEHPYTRNLIACTPARARLEKRRRLSPEEVS